MRQTLRIAAAASLLAAASSSVASAQVSLGQLPKVAVGVEAGSFGVGPTVNLHTPGSPWGVRADAAFLSPVFDFTVSNQAYRGTVNLQSMGVVADAYPFGNGFRVGAGLRLNWTDAVLSTSATQAFSFGNNVYPADAIGDVTAKVRYNRVVPYVGVGYETPVWGNNVILGGDIGAIYQGKADVSLNGTGTLFTYAPGNPDYQTVRNKIRSEANRAEFFPLVQISIGYRF